MGNLLNDGVNTLTYDGEGRLATSTPSSGGSTSYLYDADGQRVSKSAAGVETDYIRDLDGTLLDTYVSGSYINQPQEMWIAGKHYGSVTVSLQSGVQKQAEGLSLTNWLGSEAMRSIAVSNGANTGVPSYAFLSQPFGDGQTTLFGSDHDDIHFTGKERDAESGNDYFGARYYSSAMGRWMSPDKPFADQHVANPQSWNLYSYTRNNPLRFVDDDGQVVRETRDTTYYTVSGATANEALANANQHFSGEFGGMTNSYMDFTYQFSRSPSQNGDSSFTVKDTVTSDYITLKQTVGLPKWDGYDKATPDEQKAWDQAVDKLQSHETDHENINRAGADALDKALPGTSASATGKNLDPTAKAADNKLKAAVNDKATTNQQQTNQNNQHLDACTNHGTQSCK